MRSWQWAILGVLAGACFAVGVALLVVDADDDPSFPTDLRSRFVADCVEGGVTPEDCRCAADGLEEAMTPEELTAAQVWAEAGGDPDPRILEAIAACLS